MVSVILDDLASTHSMRAVPAGLLKWRHKITEMAGQGVIAERAQAAGLQRANDRQSRARLAPGWQGDGRGGGPPHPYASVHV